MTLSLALIYPELLGTYGDRGNALVLRHRARARDIDAKIIEVSPGDALPTSADIYLLGGGEDNAQTLATQMLHDQQAVLEKALKSSILFAVCAGFQILGRRFPIADGKFHDGLGIINVSTTHGSPRIIGELVTTCAIDGIGELTGFENHGGRTTLGDDEQALGVVTSGTGNGFNQVDGVVTENIIGTYLHGPALARNPLLADYLLTRATGSAPLDTIDNDPAEVLHTERLAATH